MAANCPLWCPATRFPVRRPPGSDPPGHPTYTTVLMTAVPRQVQGTWVRARRWAGLVGIAVRGICFVYCGIRSCELQTLAPRLPPFTDTPHPPSMICWASHELAGVGMIGRCVTAQPACAYPAAPGRYASMFPPRALVGWRAANALASGLVLLASRMQIRKVPNYFFLAPSPLL